MDTLQMAFYAIICGALSALAPSFGSLPGRLAGGAVTGLVAAFVWPFVRRTVGM